MLRHVDLCSGIGGFALGFQWAELSKTIMFCDTEKWCREILAKNFPNVPITNDVKELANDPERLVPDHDILTAGYPCQPFSVAGRQKGEKDDRHIWPYIFRIIACKRPTWCVFENVYGHVALGLDKVLADLESEGYSTRTFIVPACGKDAPHRRDRLWIIARLVGDTSSNGRNEIGSDKNQRSTFGQSEEGGMQEPSGRSSSVSSRPTIMADSESGGRGRNGDLDETQGSSQSDATQSDSFGGISSRPDIVGNSEHDGSLATEIGRSDEENARGSEEGSETTEQSSGASGSRHDETLSRPDIVADSESERAGKNNERIRSGISRTSRGKGSVRAEEHDVADTESERYRGGSGEERGDEQRVVFTSEQEGSSVGSEVEGRSSSCGEDVADTTSLGSQEHGYSKSGKSVEGSQNVADTDSGDERGREKPRQSEGDTSRERISDGSFDVADSDDEGSQGGIHRGENSERQSFDGHSGRSRSTHRQPEQDFWAVEPDVGRVAHGIPRRVDRLKGLGNAIVPQISMQIGLAIKEHLDD